MRTFAMIIVTTALGLTVSSSASAFVSVTLSQIGGSYNGISVSSSDSLVLSIDYAITGSSFPNVTLIDPAIDVNVVATLVSGTETPAAVWEFGAVSAVALGPPGVFTTVAPGLLDGWEKGALTPFGTAGSCIFDTSPGGSCGRIGTVTLHLTGLTGVISLGSVVQPAPFGTTITDATFVDITASSFLGTFTIVPEPSTAILVGGGLLALGIRRRRFRMR